MRYRRVVFSYKKCTLAVFVLHQTQDYVFADDIRELSRDIFTIGNVSRFVELCGGVLRVKSRE